jgi:hypothetical protein
MKVQLTTSFRGYHVGMMANGDAGSCNSGGRASGKHGKPVSGSDAWVCTDGRGALEDINDKDTFKGTPNAQRTMTCQVDGEYSLP